MRLRKHDGSSCLANPRDAQGDDSLCLPLICVAVGVALLAGAAVSAQQNDALPPPHPQNQSAFTGLAQAPEANLFVGAATTSISIEVPPGPGPLGRGAGVDDLPVPCQSGRPPL